MSQNKDAELEEEWDRSMREAIQVPPWACNTLRQTCEDVFNALGDRCGPQMSTMVSVETKEIPMKQGVHSLAREVMHWINGRSLDRVGFHDCKGYRCVRQSKDSAHYVVMSVDEREGAFFLCALVGGWMQESRT
jgi:hypothetical protein